MHQPWQKFGIETNIIEFTSGEYLANRPTAAAREISMRSGGLHPIADLKWLCHLVEPFLPQRRACSSAGWMQRQCTPRIGARLVRTECGPRQEISRPRPALQRGHVCSFPNHLGGLHHCPEVV